LAAGASDHAGSSGLAEMFAYRIRFRSDLFNGSSQFRLGATKFSLPVPQHFRRAAYVDGVSLSSGYFLFLHLDSSGQGVLSTNQPLEHSTCCWHAQCCVGES
jgi:hypothetical protein